MNTLFFLKSIIFLNILYLNFYLFKQAFADLISLEPVDNQLRPLRLNMDLRDDKSNAEF